VSWSFSWTFGRLRLNKGLAAYLAPTLVSWPHTPSATDATEHLHGAEARLHDRLTADEVERLVANYQAGALRRELA
jgi:hypothetical protein